MLRSSGRAVFSAILIFSASSALAFDTVDKSPPGSGLSPVVVFDVMGIKPGATLDEVRAVFKAEYPGDSQPVEIRLTGNVANSQGAQVKIDFLSELRRSGQGEFPRLNSKGKSADWPTVYFASEVYDNRVIGIKRDIFFAPDQFISADAMRLQLEEKYGAASASSKNTDGSTKELYYFYADGKLVQNSNYQDNGCKMGLCYGTYKESKAPDGFTDVLTAVEPCGAFAREAFYLLNDLNHRTVVKDDKCDGVLTVSFQGRSNKLESAFFTLVDVRRAYGHKQALTKAIDEALRGGMQRQDSPKPRL